jgi:ABC-type polysaccharide/polyol phosphate export permease
VSAASSSAPAADPRQAEQPVPPALERPRDGASVAGLVWTLVRTDFKARYHGTLSGFVWALLKPLSMFVVLTSVFSLVFVTDENYRLDLILGLFLWEFFAEGTKIGLMSLHAKGFLLTKARFPTWILVVTSLSNPLITISVFATLLTVFLSATGRTPSVLHLALFGAYLVAMGIIVIGISLAGSVLFLRYRDLNQVWDVVTQAGFFFAPIIYPLGVIPERYHFFLYAWPPTAVIEFSRAVLIEEQTPSAFGHLDLALVASGVLLAGVLVYRRFAPRVAEYV